VEREDVGCIHLAQDRDMTGAVKAVISRKFLSNRGAENLKEFL
jgi:hypothetical protein